MTLCQTPMPFPKHRSSPCNAYTYPTHQTFFIVLMSGIICICMIVANVLKIGDKRDKLTLVEETTSVSKSGKKYIYWICHCDCGKSTKRRKDAFFKGRYMSCGCETHNIQSANTRRIKWKGVGELSSTFFTACRQNAKKRNIDFEITMADEWKQYEKQGGICPLSNVPIKLSETTRHGHKLGSASLDRIDSSKGYTKDNIQWVHKTINLMKNVLSQDDFIQWCNKVTFHHNEQNT